MVINKNKYLTFHLGYEEYGIPIHFVKEIINMMDITNIPKAPVYMKGVMNLRGKIVPVMDLRIRCGVKDSVNTQTTCILVIEIKLSQGKKLMGVIVDSVSEVIVLSPNEIEIKTGKNVVDKELYFQSIGKIKERLVFLLDVDKVISVFEDQTIKNSKPEVTVC